jgi:pimeloyl-ACP methyl ester carboxylesterase
MPQLDLDGSAINYRDVGAGPPVILLHSSSSHSGQWRQLSDAISDTFRVLAPDLHGYGRSDPLRQDGRPYTQQDSAIVHALLDELDAPAHLVGHSLGGSIAGRVAIERSDAVASLTMIEPVFFSLLEEARDPARIEYLEVANAIMALDRFGERERAARLFLDFWIGPDAIDEMDDETREYVVRTVDRVADDWFGVSAAAPGALGVADFSGLSSPTLLVRGEATKASTQAIIEILREAIPQAVYREIPGAGHMSPVTHPALVNEIVIGFIQR